MASDTTERRRKLSHITKNLLIVVVNGPSLDYEESPTQDFEHDRKKTWNILRVLTAPQYANKITELTFARVDLLPANIFAQSSMVDFPNLRRLRILDCREFDLTNVALNYWNFIAKRGIEVVYDWVYTEIPRTHGSSAGAILCRMFKWRLEKSDARKKAIFDNLKTDRQFRRHIDRAFRSHWVPPILDDPGLRTADDVHDFVFKEDKTEDLSKAVTQTIHGFHANYAGNLARNFDCRECGVEMTGACFPC